MMYVWLTVVIFLAFIEVATVNLVTIWFIASGIVSLILSFVVDDFVIELAVFVILGIFLLITTRPILNKYIKPKNVKTNFDRIIGMEGIVTEEISKHNLGEVKVDGKKWTAMSDKIIRKGETVIIIDIQGVKVKVKKCEE